MVVHLLKRKKQTMFIRKFSKRCLKCGGNLEKQKSSFFGKFEFYELEDRTIANSLVEFNYVSYDGLNYLGYTPAKSIQINNTKSTILEGIVQLKPSTGLHIVPKIIINYI